MITSVEGVPRELTPDEKRFFPNKMQVDLLIRKYGTREVADEEAIKKGGWIDLYSAKFRDVINASLAADPDNNFLTRYRTEPEVVLGEIELLLYGDKLEAVSQAA
jgi:hypothetical protein